MERDQFAIAGKRLWEQRPLRKPHLRDIASELRSGRPEIAAQRLRNYLDRHPDDPDAMCLMARALTRLGRDREADRWCASCLELAPDFSAARFLRTNILVRLHHYGEAAREADQLVISNPDNPLFRQLSSEILCAIGEEEGAAAIRRQIANENPGRPACWISLADTLRTIGCQEESISAYRRAIQCRPSSSGLGWWGLANLKTFRFDEADIEAMQALLKQEIRPDDRINLMFSLGKALEDRCSFDQSFAWYARANAARRLGIEHDWNAIGARLAADKAVFTAEFLASRNGAGCERHDPIFILGRPRSGSTLVEQILAGHSAIEATAELPYLADIAVRLEAEHSEDLPTALAKLEPETLTALGEEYLERAAIHRKSGRIFFIDKAPANYHQIGLILLILPNAKIIDVRRHPAACCWSMFKHNYVDSNLRLAELGCVYRDYISLLAHFDRVAPGRIHRVIYENLIADPERETRSLLDYLGLPYEENCLRFHESGRAVRTPSSEQVRRPISGEAADHWRNFEPWLSPLLAALGSALDSYPAVPAELE